MHVGTHVYIHTCMCIFTYTCKHYIPCICKPICEYVYTHIYLNLFTHLISALNRWILFTVFIENSPDICYSARGPQTDTTPSPYQAA